MCLLQVCFRKRHISPENCDVRVRHQGVQLEQAPPLRRKLTAKVCRAVCGLTRTPCTPAAHASRRIIRAPFGVSPSESPWVLSEWKSKWSGAASGWAF